MTNTIIDMVRIPVDENGVLKYDLDEVYQIFEAYTKLYPDHMVFVMPADVTIWEDLDLLELENIRDCLSDIINKKKGIDE